MFLWTILLTLALAKTVGSPSEIGPPPANPFESFLSFVTNLPPINDMVVEVEFGFKPQRYQFRYQQDAFFGRLLGSTNSAADADCVLDSMCGRWKDDYWYYDPTSKTLHEYHFAQNDTNASGYVGQVDFKTCLGLFQSFGSSDQGLNSLFWHNDRLTFVDTFRHCTNYLTLHLSNGVPRSASMERTMDGGTAHFVSAWSYDTNVAPLGIPVAVNLDHSEQKWIRLRTLTLGSQDRPLPRESFFPSCLFTNQTIARIAHTNSADYLVKDGKMSPWSVQAEELAERKTARTGLFMGLLFVTLLVVPAWLAFSKRHKHHE